MGAVRLTTAQALVRFLAAQHVERDGVEQPLLRRRSRHLRPRQRRRDRQALQQTPSCSRTTRRATSRRWCTPPPAYARMRNRLATFACTTSIGPGATNMITGAAAATINRLPVLLLPGDIFARAQRGPGAAAARGSASERRLGQRLLQAGLALLGPHQPPRADRAGGAARRCACSPNRPRPARSRSRCRRTCRPRRSTYPASCSPQARLARSRGRCPTRRRSHAPPS